MKKLMDGRRTPSDGNGELKKRVLVSKQKKPTYPTLKVRVGERGNKHFVNCCLICNICSTWYSHLIGLDT